MEEKSKSRYNSTFTCMDTNNSELKIVLSLIVKSGDSSQSFYYTCILISIAIMLNSLPAVKFLIRVKRTPARSIFAVE